MKTVLRLIMCMICLLSASLAMAYDFTRQGVYYKINADKVSVCVTYITSHTVTPSDGTGATTTTTTYNNSIKYEDEIIIPDSVKYNDQWYPVTAIGDHAFENCSKLTNVVFGKNVTTIGVQAFKKCGLKSISIGENVTSIKKEAFISCSGLSTIDFPDGLTEVNKRAFNGTAWYTAQPKGVLYAGPVAYCYKNAVPENTDIVIKEGTKVIASGLFFYSGYGPDGPESQYDNTDWEKYFNRYRRISRTNSDIICNFAAWKPNETYLEV